MNVHLWARCRMYVFSGGPYERSPVGQVGHNTYVCALVDHTSVHLWGPSRTYVCALVDHTSVHLWGPSRTYVCALVDHRSVHLWA